MQALICDIRLAVRFWRRSPTVAGAAAASLALGIAAVTVVFSAVSATLLRPLPGTTTDVTTSRCRGDSRNEACNRSENGPKYVEDQRETSRVLVVPWPVHGAAPRLSDPTNAIAILLRGADRLKLATGNTTALSRVKAGQVAVLHGTRS